MDLEKIIKQIETEFIKILIKDLKAGQIKLEDAKAQTREFLGLLPVNDTNELQTKLKLFTDKYDWFKAVYVTFLKINEETKTQEIIMKMKNLINKNEVDKALELVK